jgi:hypothetical protein
MMIEDFLDDTPEEGIGSELVEGDGHLAEEGDGHLAGGGGDRHLP